MRASIRGIALAVGLIVLTFVWMSPRVFAPSHNPPPPPACEVIANIQGPSQGTVGEELKFAGSAETQNCSPSRYSWTLSSAPQGVGAWSATGQEVSYTSQVAGEYAVKLEVTATGMATGVGSTEQKFTIVARSSQSLPQPSSVQELAIIIGPSNNQLRTYPEKLTISTGHLRLFLTSLERSVTIVIRLEGAQAGVATVLVEPGKLATVEVQLAQGIYHVLDQGTNTSLGQIEAR